MKKMLAVVISMAFILGTTGFAVAQTKTPVPELAPTKPAPKPPIVRGGSGGVSTTGLTREAAPVDPAVPTTGDPKADPKAADPKASTERKGMSSPSMSGLSRTVTPPAPKTAEPKATERKRGETPIDYMKIK